MKQETIFYEEIQKREGLDLRGNRGKKHDLALTLLYFTIVLFRKRDGMLSSIHGSIENKHKELYHLLSIEYEVPAFPLSKGFSYRKMTSISLIFCFAKCLF